ncbi:hypothetical protein [Amaricoccus solimangrovi]|uniref:Lipoprotein n=1 Tax=Amaricoccus solimangrovi TaxID=2589815 RepID=A0A501WXE1_9RHOB|nr:hypothetical protein [Amaricoccus solimangrovi]TPE52107.1 hypothetical protein FJM51_06685 [Amaricoccus solimangrovi]
MSRLLLAAVVAATLSGCEFYTPASPEEIARARYISPEPPSITLLSMVDERSDKSAHAGLLINGSQQVLFDPAGTFTHPDLPRAGDIHYGMTPRFVDYYERYHARAGYYVETQRVAVTKAEADRIFANAVEHGKSLKMECALAVADVLKPVPPFTGVVGSSLFPESIHRDFAELPGVRTHRIYENDKGQNKVWEEQDATAPGPKP